jgi:hypothetical protein
MQGTRSWNFSTTHDGAPGHQSRQYRQEDIVMGRGILLWLLGVPIPIIILLAFCTHQ